MGLFFPFSRILEETESGENSWEALVELSEKCDELSDRSNDDGNSDEP